MRNYQNKFFRELDSYLDSCEEIHKLVSLVKKHCDINKDSDDLYEISAAINIIEEKLNQLSFSIFAFIHNYDTSDTIKEALKEIQEKAIIDNEI